MKTSEMLVEKYDWYKIPPSVHKLLEHGYQIADYFDLPVGLYSEEAQEACNKIVRNARLGHTARISRMNTMMNQVHYLLLRSDPIISSISYKKQKSIAGKPQDKEVLELLED